MGEEGRRGVGGREEEGGGKEDEEEEEEDGEEGWRGVGGREEEISLGVIMTNTEIKFHMFSLFTLH